MHAVTFTTSGALSKSSLREANDRVVLLAVLRHPGSSRLDIARMTGLSPSAITGITDRLMEQDLLVEGRRDAGRAAMAGRPRAPIFLKAAARLAIGVAIGNQNATVALADFTGRVLAQQAIEAQPTATYLARVHAAIRQFAAEAGEKALGVAVSIPGNVDPATGRVRQATNLAWHDVDALAVLKGDLTLPFSCENNSDLAAFAERWFGEEPLRDNFVFVTLRVGIGAGIILNGQLVRGARHCAGEFGHVTLVPGGRECVCGQRGCWEEYASDRALVRRYGEHGGTAALDSLAVVARARQGDVAAMAALAETATSLALGLCPVILGLNPAAIVLDDWGAAGWDLIQERVWQVIAERVPAAWREGVEIMPSSRAEDASLTGAIALVLARFFTSFQPQHPGDAVRLSL